MNLIKQSHSLKINNHDWVKPTTNLRHGNLLPNTIRAIIVGPSNCGKTNVMLSLLENQNGVRFENVYIFSKSLYQPIYEYLEKLLQPIKGISYFKFKDSDNIVPPSDAKPNSVFIFDDVACDPQSVIRDYFSMGRHNAIDCFYLCQTYSHIPKHLIRDNANLIVVFKQDETNLKHIYQDHVNTDFNYEKFQELCRFCWSKDKYSFLVISKDNDINNGRYRLGFDNFINIKLPN